MPQDARRRPRLYTIAPDVPFLPALARALLDGMLPEPQGAPLRPRDLADWTIWLPTRRTARILAAELLEAAPAQAQILARIQPLGDVDEDELSLAAAEEAAADLPPPVPPLIRQFILADLVREWAQGDDSPLAGLVRDHGGEAMKMARALAQLLDSFENEDVPFSALDRLLNDDRPRHRLAARALLRHVRQGYRPRLERIGCMDAARRRARLIHARARAYAEAPPSGPVVAAGSTGTIPATAELLKVVAHLPQGCVILPGLDRDMDEQSWRALPEGHPQFGMKQLLEKMDAHRSEVADLPGIGTRRTPAGASRTRLLSEVMRPAETTELWPQVIATQGRALRRALQGLRRIHAEDRHAEARIIALVMRGVLEESIRDPATGRTRPKTAALITPDRALARQVRAELARWGVEVDDSAGQPLADTPPGQFVKLLLEAALEGFAPPQLAALAGHPLTRAGLERGEFLARFGPLETAVLRHLPVFPGLDGLAAAVRRRERQVREAPWREHRAVRALQATAWPRMERTAQTLADILAPLEAAFRQPGPAPFTALLEALFGTAERLSGGPGGACALWEHDAGEALAGLVSELLEHAAAAPDLSPRDMGAFLMAELAQRPLRRPQVAQARLSILGLLEARLVPADVKILAGLNEDIWPPVAQNDPFLNRPDRRELNLPVPERRIGLTAHDFVQAAANAECWLTSSARIDQQPAVASRWLLRLQALLGALGQKDACAPERPWAAWAARLDDPGQPPQPIPPPRPRPPLHMRPQRLSVSRVAGLMRQPFAFFAEHILDLAPLPDLACAVSAADLGSAIHAALERFCRAHPGPALPADAEAELAAMLHDALAEILSDAASLRWWQTRTQRMAAWLMKREQGWRKGLERAHAEVSGRLDMEIAGRAFTLSARADRIDILANGMARLIDFKTGQLPSLTPEADKYDPQLDLEAAMLRAGSFEGVPAAQVAQVALVRLSGGKPAGEIRATRPGEDISARADHALQGLRRLMTAYGREKQAYLPAGFAKAPPYMRPHAHLARWQEWRHTLAARREDRREGGGR